MTNKGMLNLLKEPFSKNWEELALQDFNTDISYKYKDFAAKIEELHIIFKAAGIERGDRIALIGRNTSHWAISFMSIISYGAVVVPILDEFNPRDVVHILNHSKAKLFLCDESMWSNYQTRDFETVVTVISTTKFALLYNDTENDIKSTIKGMKKLMKEKFPNGLTYEKMEWVDIEPDDLTIINYTSGTTSLTKGVMLTARNLATNIEFGIKTYTKIGHPSQRALCVLPLAHVYGLMFGYLLQIAFGTSITFLGKLPSPKILLDACASVKPTMLLFVPLIFEKIYKFNIAPKINKGIVGKLRLIPFVNDLICRKAGKTLYDLFGGELYEVIVGGAAINPEVEKFLIKAKFPFTVGYGMTECAPLISYIPNTAFKPQSVGKALDNGMVIRIDKEQESDPSGEIQVKGDQVMMGYYGDEEATKSTFTDDGWLKTGDLGCIDKDGYIYIKGRSKTMLLGPSGENIYPEAIESKLNNMPFIAESIVMQNKQHKLIAFVYPDYPMIEKAKISLSRLNRLMANNRRTLNEITAKYENIQRIIVVEEPFAKTPKNTPKRYGLEYLIEKYDAEKD
ncbi:MAG: AMP-binding protein [Rikenellaceae bacterium]